MANPKLSEALIKLLPGEANKRIRQGILLAATEGKAEARTVKNEINQENRLKTGVLGVGTIEFTSGTSADLDRFAWVIDFANYQPDALTLAVQAPHPTVSRPDIFTGNALGQITYYPGTVDAEGNAFAPSVPDGEVLLRQVNRNPNGGNEPDNSVPTTFIYELIRRVQKVEIDLGKVISQSDQTASDLTDLETQVQVIETDLNTLEIDFETLESRVTTNEEDITNLGNQITLLEPAFTKNTAFNKNFGNTAGTVAEGNDPRIVAAFAKMIQAISVTGDANKTITLTREDGTVLTASFLGIDPENPEDVINTLTFNLANGALVAVTSEGAVISVSLDGRYSLLGHIHNAADIEGIDNYITVLADARYLKLVDAALLEGRIQTVEADLIDLENQVQIIETDLDTLETEVQAVAAKATANEATINVLETDLTDLENQTQGIETDLNALEVEVDAVESRVTQSEADINLLESDVNDLENQVQTVETDLNLLETEVQTVESKAIANEAAINDLENQTQNIESDVSDLKIEVTELGLSKADQTYVDAGLDSKADKADLPVKTFDQWCHWTYSGDKVLAIPDGGDEQWYLWDIKSMQFTGYTMPPLVVSYYPNIEARTITIKDGWDLPIGCKITGLLEFTTLSEITL